MLAKAIRKLTGFRELSHLTEHRKALPPLDFYAFDSANWVAYQSNPDQQEPAKPYAHQAAFKLLCGLLGDVRVFDLGGGPAVAYPIAKAGSQTLEYTCLENAALCEIGAKAFPDVRFITSPEPTDANLAICIGTLQYCLEWEETLSLLVASRPEFVLIGRHYTLPTLQYGLQTLYATTGYCGQAHLVFVPADLLAQAMGRLGYSLLSDIQIEDESSKIPGLTSRAFVFRAGRLQRPA